MGLTETVQSLGSAADSKIRPDPQLGLVRWGDDLDAALAISRKSGRPVFCFVQGAGYPATVFGEQVLGSTELARMIEAYFEPVLAHAEDAHL
eukprot:scaffold111242_cov21-Prasinocladus_malaysianus.AAC.1